MRPSLAKLVFVAAVIAAMPKPRAVADLLVNPSFETVPSSETGQGFLPSDFVSAASIDPGADTYSNDGSYGLTPAAFGNFPGLTAQDGIRWVAGADFGTTSEAFGQALSTPLIPALPMISVHR